MQQKLKSVNENITIIAWDTGQATKTSKWYSPGRVSLIITGHSSGLLENNNECHSQLRN